MTLYDITGGLLLVLLNLALIWTLGSYIFKE